MHGQLFTYQDTEKNMWSGHMNPLNFKNVFKNGCLWGNIAFKAAIDFYINACVCFYKQGHYCNNFLKIETVNDVNRVYRDWWLLGQFWSFNTTWIINLFCSCFRNNSWNRLLKCTFKCLITKWWGRPLERWKQWCSKMLKLCT